MVRRYIKSILLAVSFLAASPGRLLACPYCGSEVSERVWAGIFNGDFWLNAGLTLLPVPILLAIVALIHAGRHALPHGWRRAAPAA